MEHPFTKCQTLTTTQQDQVSGGSSQLFERKGVITPGECSPIIKPPICTTLAIGEEGGSLATLF